MERTLPIGASRNLSKHKGMYITVLELVYVFLLESSRQANQLCSNSTQQLHICLQVLLQSDKVPANFSDRSLLKNLGHWLGLMTLAQNKPVLMRVSFVNM